MKSILLTLAAVTAALATEPPSRVASPVLGYVFDSKVKGVRPITGIAGAASLDDALPNASKLANGFVSQNGEWLLAVLLDGGIELKNLRTGATSALEGAPEDVVLGAWSADDSALALWSRSGLLQVWSGLPEAPALKFTQQADSAAGIAIAGDGQSVLVWSDAGLFIADASGVRPLLSEPVIAASFGGSSEWAAITKTQLLRSGAEPIVLAIERASAVAFTTTGLLVAGKGAVEAIDGSTSTLLACECEATVLARLAGANTFRLTGLGAGKLAVYDGSGAEPKILYIPTEGDRQ
jgi:hypothetical protein